MPKTPRNETVRNGAITTHYSDQRQIADAHHSNSLVPRGFTKTMVSILISSGILVVGFQSYVYFNFTIEYDSNSLPSEHYGEYWDAVYTGLAMSSGSADAVAGFFLACVLRASSKMMLIAGTVFTFLVATASALAGLSVVGELVKLYNDQEIPQHVCVAASSNPFLTSTCTTWWWLELCVVIFCGFALIASFACFVILCVDLNTGHYRKNAPTTSLTFPRVAIVSDEIEYYGNEAEEPQLKIPRIGSQMSTDSSDASVIRKPRRAARVPPHQPQNEIYRDRPSLPIIIRNKTKSIYFY